MFIFPGQISGRGIAGSTGNLISGSGIAGSTGNLCLTF